MVCVSECTLPKAGLEYTDESKDFVFFRLGDKKQANSVKFTFVGQKVFKTNQLAEFNLSDEGTKKKDSQTLITRPRNCFIIMRTLIHNVIIRCLEKCDISSLKHVSAITSQLWGKNDGIFQLYFELLSQFEEHWHLNIYPEYRYHKVNKISGQLENKLVYQNMLNRMRYFTASSLSSKLEGILTFPVASAADTAVDATAAAEIPTAAEPFSSTYTYFSLSFHQSGVNHQYHSRQQHRQVINSTVRVGKTQQQDFASPQERKSFDALHNKRPRADSVDDGKLNRKNRCTAVTQETLCDRIKFGLPKRNGRSLLSLKRARKSNTSRSKESLNQEQNALKTVTTSAQTDPTDSTRKCSALFSHGRIPVSQQTFFKSMPFKDVQSTSVPSTMASSTQLPGSNVNSLRKNPKRVYSKPQCMVGSKQRLDVQDLYLEKKPIIVLSSDQPYND